jgi:sarcosine oxidase subunit beta
MRYSFFSIARQALNSHKGWTEAWKKPQLQSRYDVVIIGGGGHGLATAYYLAKLNSGLRVAVLERGWIGGGNTGRNTTVVRSNYFLKENADFYEHSLKLWENLTQELNFNLMFSQRGVVQLCHSFHDMEGSTNRYNALRLNGIDSDVLTRTQLQAMLPDLNYAPDARFPISGAVIQRRAGVARHDAVAWGFARAASGLGVDIIENCEVTDIDVDMNVVTGVRTSKGNVRCDKIGICVAGHTSEVARLAGLKLPIETHLLQAMVTEPVKPFLHTAVASSALHCYISQTDKGELLIGGGIDGYNSYSQRGTWPKIEEVVSGAISMFPRLRGLRLMRTWAGVMDMTMDGSPIIGKTPVKHLYIDGGWCIGGFKAIPGAGWCFAHTIVDDKPHPLNAAFSLERFRTGRLLSEQGGGNTPHRQAH